MNTLSDQQLLRDYVDHRSEAVFDELVRRHVDLVYSAALRMVADRHLAEDVTQNVFIALAQNAGRLTNHPTLSGWLHRTTQNISANVVRSDMRRRVREQEVVAMNELLSSDSTPPWKEVVPALDAALGELSETERDAVLLRYFERKPATEMAQLLGISSKAAQKRVSRGVEHLRELLAKRGVAVGASGLVVLVSANAVHAAPVGLTATISTAAALGSATPFASATTLAKTIAMTTLQKVTIGTTLTLAIGVAIFQTERYASLHRQVQSLQQQQLSLQAQLQQTQTVRDDASNQLATLNRQLVQLKLSQEQRELLKLRGDVGMLRQKLAANTNGAASGLEKMMKDPAAREYNRQIILKGIKSRYAAFFQELKLNPEQIEQFSQLFSELYMKFGEIASAQKAENFTVEQLDRLTADAQVEFGKQLLPILGEEGLKRMKEFANEIPARTVAQLLTDQLGGRPLSAKQNDQLLEVVKAEPYEITHGIEGDMNPAFMGSKEDIQRYLARLAESNQRIVQKASSFLSDDQIIALGTVLTNSVNTRLAQAAIFGKKP